ncbi:MAG: translation elongation factor Ts [Caldisericia bacterium]|nr:translation elongation factor Ts [Caldisericia bacterium]MDD4615228.1 translation elongation factor Ts [Caldisericia bacterium]
MSVDMKLIKELRTQTSAGVSDCKVALEENNNDFEKAVEYLRKKGLATAEKKASRETNQGRIEAYVHHDGKLGVLLEVNCETDFVASNDDFKKMCHRIAMQIAINNPEYVSREQVPAERIEKEKQIYRDQMKDSGKPDHVIEKIIEGKVDSFYADTCLLEMEDMFDNKKTIQDIVKETIGVIGENMTVKRFARFKVGE